MFRINTTGRAGIFAAVILCALVSCENLFEQGLGGKVNVTPPEIRVLRPAVGDVIKGNAAVFSGEAVDDRKVVKIEAVIYPSLGDEEPPEAGWSAGGIEYDGSKNWTFTIDTTAITTAEVNPAKDGTIKIQFRVFDEGSAPVETAALAYIVKNNPPDISVTTPEESMGVIVTGENIRGSAEDARGVKPGYPMIQIWPVSEYPGDTIPPEDDLNWGWASARIPGFAVNDLAHLGGAKTAPQFEFPLNNFTINPDTRQAEFGATPLPVGQYRFRLKVRDYALERNEAGELEENPAAEKERLYPDSVTGKRWRDIELAESLEAVRINLDPEAGDPWIRMENSTEYKTVSGSSPDRTLFVFRVRAAHSQGVQGAVLQWKRDGEPDSALRPLAWDDGTGGDPGSLGGLVNGAEADPANIAAGKWFTFTAKGTHADLFPSGSVPYVFSVQAKSYAGIVSAGSFSVYMDGAGPKIEITAVKGAYAEPSSPGGGYNVNGNIEVSVTITDDETGIKTRDDDPQAREAAWKLVPAGEQAVLDGLIAGYREQPGAGLLEDILAGTALIGGSSFCVPTGDDGEYGLYILALDKARNLGVAIQKLIVEQEGDKPVITVPGMIGAIEGPAGLGIVVDEDRNRSGNTARQNIVVAGQDVEIAFSDDDGLDLGTETRPSGVRLYITDEPAVYGRQQIPDETIKGIFGVNGAAAVREKSGVLRLEHLAGGLYREEPEGTRPAALRDGVYRLEIEVSDRAGDKVGIGAGVAAAESAGSFWFAVYTEPPLIEVTGPPANALRNADPVPVYGTVKSRHRVQQLWASVVNASTGGTPLLAEQNLVLWADENQSVPAAEAEANDEGGYSYYWRLEDVNFDGDGLAGVKTVELEAADGLANFGFLSHPQIVDRGLPETALLAFEGMAAGSTDVNGIIRFTVTASDDYGLAGVRWWILPAAASPPEYGYGFDDDKPFPPADGSGAYGEFGGSPYTASVNTADPEDPADPALLNDGGDYVLYVIARDQAGNISASRDPGEVSELKKHGKLQAFHVDQSTDKPGIGGELGLSGGAVAAPSTAVIAGLAGDDDGFSGPAGFVEVRFPAVSFSGPEDPAIGDEESWGPAAAVAAADGAAYTSGTLVNAGTSIEFRFDIPAYMTTLAESSAVRIIFTGGDGPRYYQIRVSDDGARKGGAAAVSGGWETHWFTLDSQPPKIGFAWADPGDSPPPPRPTYQNTADLAAQTAGGVTEANIAVSPDYPNGSIELSYNAEDYRQIGLTPVEDCPEELKALAADRGWNRIWKIDEAYFTDAATPFTASGEAQNITLLIRDLAGNETRVQWDFYKDQEGPAISTTTITAAVIPPDLPAYWAGWTDGSSAEVQAAANPPTLTGALIAAIATWDPDTRNLADKAGILAALKKNAAVVTGGTAPSPGGGTPADPDNPPAVIRGSMNDLLSFMRDNDDDAATFEYRFNSGGAADTVKAWEEARPLWGTAAGVPVAEADRAAGQKTVYWEIPIPQTDAGGNPVPDGPNTFDIRAKDKAGNETAVYNIGFRVDRAVPEIVVAGPDVSFFDDGYPVYGVSGGSTDGTIFTLKGTVADVNFDPADTVSALTAVLKSGAYQVNKGSLKGSLTADGGNTWKWELPITDSDILALHGDDASPKTVSITAVDGAGREWTETWSFYTDTVSPVIEFGNLERGAAGTAFTAESGRTITLRGTARDSSGIRVLKYLIAKWDYSAGSAGEWRWWNEAGTAWTGTTEPGVDDWPSLLDGAYVPANQVSWKLEISDSNCAAILHAAGITAAEGRYRFKVYAEDFAAHDINPGNPVSTDDDHGGAYDDGGAGLSPRIVFLDRANPTLSFASAVTEKTYFKKGYGGGDGDKLQFTGTVQDGNTVASVRGRFDNSQFTNTGSIANKAAAEPFSGTGAQNWTLDMPLTAAYASKAGDDGAYTLFVEAVDGAGKTTVISKDFILDNTPPELTITTHPAGGETDNIVTGQVIVRGISSDAESNVAGVEYYLGTSGAPVWQGADPYKLPQSGSDVELSQFNGGTTSWYLDLKDMSNFILGDISAALGLTAGYGAPNVTFDGIDIAGKTIYDLPVHFRVTDNAGNEKAVDTTLRIYPEGDKPVVTILNPGPGSPEAERSVGGEVTLFGLARDNDWVWDVVCRVVDAGTGSPVELYNSNGTKKTPEEKGGLSAADRWYLTDNGAYGSSVSWNARINSAGELNPDINTARKRYRIEVMAFDTRPDESGGRPEDTSPHDGTYRRLPGEARTVELIVENGVPVFAGERLLAGKTSDAWVEAEARPLSGGAAASKKSSYKTIIRDEGGIKTISWRRTAAEPWTVLMDVSGGGTYVDPEPAYTGGLSAALAAGGIAAMAKPKTLGLGTASYTLEQDVWYLIWDPVDSAAEAALGLHPAGGVDNNRRFTAVKPAASTAITEGSVIPAVHKDGSPYVPGGQPYYEWEVTVDLDTETVLSGDNGSFSVELQAADITSPVNFTANKTVRLDVDNYYPMGTYTGNSYAAGMSYTVQGTAGDAGPDKPVQGIWKVALWFEKGGQQYNPLTGELSGPGETVTAAAGRYALPSGTAPPAAESVTIPSGSYTIDADNPLGTPATGFARNGDNREWYVRLNVSELADTYPAVFSGPVTLKYLVYDNAGNASVYEQTLLFRENAPVITSVTLGTDLRNNSALRENTGLTLKDIRGTFPAAWADSRKGISGRVTINHNSTGGYDAGSGFTVRNKLLVLRVEAAAAKAGRQYRVYYVTGNEEVSAGELVNGSVYTIRTDGGVNWDAVGAPPGWRAAHTANPETVPFMASGSTPYGDGAANLFNTTGELTKTGTTGDVTADIVFNPAAFGADKIADSDTAKFVIKVWDGNETDGAADFVVLNVRVKNTDDTAPGTVTLYDLNPATEEVAGADVAAVQELAARPGGIGQNRTRGGLYNFDVTGSTLKRSGHIEPGKDTGFTAGELGITSNTLLTRAYDTVSGTVILRGYAEDDMRVGGVSLDIGGVEVAVLEAASAVSTPITNENNTGLLTVPSAQAGKVFFADTVGLDGHRVEWAYVWNTQELPSDVNTIGETLVTVTAANSGTNLQEAEAGRTLVRAPYVTGVEREKASYSSGRSVQGWYGFTRDEAVKLTGFNFKGGAASLTVPGAAAVTGVTPVDDTVASRPPGHTAAFTVPAGAKSGALAFSVGTTPSVNAVSGERTVFPWNGEMSAEEGSDLWDDRISAHVWQSDDTAIAYNNTETLTDRGKFSSPVGTTLPLPNSTNSGTFNWPIENPSMSVDPSTGNLVGVYGTDETLGYVISTRNNQRYTSSDILFSWELQAGETDTHYNEGVQYTVYNVLGQGTQSGQTAVWNDWGGIYIQAPGGSSTGIVYYMAAGGSTSHYLVEKTAYNANAAQFANPHIVTFKDGGAMRMHVSYYDSKDGSIKYRLHTQGSPGHMSEVNPRNWINLDGGFDAEDYTSYTNTYNVQTADPAYSSHGSTARPYIRQAPRDDGWVNVGDTIVVFDSSNTLATTNDYEIKAPVSGEYKWLIARTVGTRVGTGTPSIFEIVSPSRVLDQSSRPTPRHDVGFYNAIDVTSQGYPVVVYQDRTAGTLKLARSDSAAPTAASNWTVQDVFPSGDPNRTNAGDYVSFRIDPADNTIHIAAIRGADLIYISGTRNGDGSYTFSPSLAVDSPGGAGKWADLSLDEAGNPYITYLIRGGTYGGARMVFRDTTQFDKALNDGNNNSIRGWEAMSVPARYRVHDHRLSVENFPVRGGSGGRFWHAAVGYIGDATTAEAASYRAAYYVKY